MDTLPRFARIALRLLTPLLLLGSTTAWSARETRWTLIDLNPPGANFTVASAVNNHGVVAGWYNTPCPEHFVCERPFVGDGGAYRTLPTPPDMPYVRVRGIQRLRHRRRPRHAHWVGCDRLEGR
jgi:hypothetical protein